jgi:hypothetical protein
MMSINRKIEMKRDKNCDKKKKKTLGFYPNPKSTTFFSHLCQSLGKILIHRPCVILTVHRYGVSLCA